VEAAQRLNFEMQQLQYFSGHCLQGMRLNLLLFLQKHRPDLKQAYSVHRMLSLHTQINRKTIELNYNIQDSAVLT